MLRVWPEKEKEKKSDTLGSQSGFCGAMIYLLNLVAEASDALTGWGALAEQDSGAIFPR